MRVEELLYSPFIPSHKLILLYYIVYHRYTDFVDRNYVVYTKKIEARSFSIFQSLFKPESVIAFQIIVVHSKQRTTTLIKLFWQDTYIFEPFWQDTYVFGLLYEKIISHVCCQKSKKFQCIAHQCGGANQETDCSSFLFPNFQMLKRILVEPMCSINIL